MNWTIMVGPLTLALYLMLACPIVAYFIRSIINHWAKKRIEIEAVRLSNIAGAIQIAVEEFVKVRKGV